MAQLFFQYAGGPITRVGAQSLLAYLVQEEENAMLERIDLFVVGETRRSLAFVLIVAAEIVAEGGTRPQVSRSGAMLRRGRM